MSRNPYSSADFSPLCPSKVDGDSRHWHEANDLVLARYFEGENVWAKNWERIDARALVPDHYGGELELVVWQASFGGRREQFAAAEVSNAVWVFALPRSRS